MSYARKESNTQLRYFAPESQLNALRATLSIWLLGELLSTIGQDRQADSDIVSDPLLAKLHELTNLPNGWHFGEGIPPQPSAVRIARKIYKHPVSFGLQADVFPGEDGSLSLVFYAGELCVEINISPDGTLNLSVEEGEGFDFEELRSISNASFDEAIAEVGLLANSNIWDSSGFFTQSTSIDGKDDFAALVSSTPVMEQESLWSKPTASGNSPLLYVNT